MLNEIHHIEKTNPVWYLVYVESKNIQIIKAEGYQKLEDGGMAEMFKGTYL